MGQTLEDQLFAHWRVPLDGLRAHVPAALEVEQHDGSAWLGITSFRVTGLRLRGLLPVPGLSTFAQLNVRTYVRAPDGRPGVWFLSLDASSRVAVETARRLYALPYSLARMTVDRDGTWIDCECARVGERGRVFSARYRPEGDELRVTPGSLEAFLTERYCLYTAGREGTLLRAEIHHAPWRLQQADAEVELVSIAPLVLTGTPVCHFSRRQDFVVWPLEPVL